jgi:RNA polymerase sigma-70 factor (ECF subfamily)
MAGYLGSLQFIEDFRQGKNKAFESVYNTFYDEIYCFAYKMADNISEAQDITSETFWKLFQKRQSFDSASNIKAFLYITARNSCLDYLRRRKMMVARHQILAGTLDETFDLENHLLDIAYLKKVKATIESLPPRQREAIQLLYYEELKYKEVAEAMGITHWTVAELRERALSSLRKLLQKEQTAEMVPLLLIALYCFL